MEKAKRRSKKITQFILNNYKDFDTEKFADNSYWVDMEDLYKQGTSPYMNPKYNLIILN